MTNAAEPKCGPLSLWFNFAGPVSRRAYLATGLALMALEYIVEPTVVYAVTKRVWTPMD
jgi:hypothetical protein